MNNRSASGRILGVLGMTAALALGAGCGPKAADINHVQPGYVKKSIFQTGDEWYYRRTVAKSETLNAYAIEGGGDIFLDRVKFKVTEDQLIAYKPYEAIEGAQDGQYAGKTDFQGPILAAWSIDEHFDIKRDYDPATGNTTNVIEENTTDRPWSDREYIRVDWAHNLIDSDFVAGYGANEFPISYISSGHYWTDQDTSPTDPYASRFTKDYIDVTDNAILGMDLITCAWFVGVNGDAYSHCGYGEAKVRHSFTRIAQKSDYQPREYPDSIIKTGADGKAQYDDATGELLREPIYDRFGFFRIETPTYDVGYGTTESGRVFRATLHNIWERHLDDNGHLIPMEQRKPKPIVYYLNTEYPARWRKVASEVAAEYNRVFKSMVADVTHKSLADTPDMFVIKDNDCNVDNVKAFVTNNADYTFAVMRAVCKDGEACDNPMGKIGVGNLENVCSSLEAATRDPETGLPKFDWQRIGDNRFKMLVWLANPQDSGWGGYGPMHADAKTGESVSATAFIRGWDYETYSATIVDWIDFMNGKLSVEDVIYGQNTRQDVAEIRKYVDQVHKRAKKQATDQAGEGLIARTEGKLASFGATKNERLQEMDPNEQINRIRRINGTSAEDKLISNEDLILASLGKWRPGMPVSKELHDAVTPTARVTNASPFAAARDKARRMLTSAGFCFLRHDFDPNFAGVAYDLQNIEDRDQRYQIVGERTLKHVILHELGHNMGLAHNFEGSYDALNYYPDFWRLYNASDDDKVQGGFDEHRNTTVMEYLSAKGMFSDRLGQYDEAALRFGYVNQIQVFKKADIDGGFNLKNWRLQNDYSSIPDHLCGGTCGSEQERQDVISQREWKTMTPGSTDFPANEVPYLFCDNTYDRRTPFCATFDYGSSLREIQANYYTMWSKYFYFNNFIRDRLTPQGWDPFSAQYPALYAMLNINIVNQYLYYYSALDPSFVRTPIGKDMLATVAQGLNMASEIISTPEPIRSCPWPQSNPAIYIPYYYFDGGRCDQYTPINSDKSITESQIQVPLGPARPASIGFTDDFVEYQLSFIGSYFDKQNVLQYLGMNSARIFKFSYDLDLRTYRSGLYRLFENELKELMSRLVTFDPYLINQETATNLGSFWCKDPENMDQPYRGSFQPRSMITVDTGESWPVGVPADCAQGGIVYPTLLRNMPFQAMFWAHALYSSPRDSQLDLGKLMKVYAHGAEDDFPAWESIPVDRICSVTDNYTGLEYRAIRPADGQPDIACRLIDRTKTAQIDWQNDPTNDFQKERSRSWFERLEFQRDLMRIYNP
ncbi:MAG: M66 family metalloprotease [Myxococcota bacterium]